MNGTCKTTTTINTVATSVTAGAPATKTITVGSAAGFGAGQQVFIHQTQGVGAGNYELNSVASIAGSTITLANALANTYSSTGGFNHAQVVVAAVRKPHRPGVHDPHRAGVEGHHGRHPRLHGPRARPP